MELVVAILEELELGVSLEMPIGIGSKDFVEELVVQPVYQLKNGDAGRTANNLAVQLKAYSGGDGCSDDKECDQQQYRKNSLPQCHYH